MTDTLNHYQVSYQHKDRLFRFIFKEKAALLSLYNAINNSNYQDTEALQIYTMEDFVYMGMKNDLSFLIDWNLGVFEHQSTYNPNMPLRGLLYMAASYRKYIELNRLDIYTSKQLILPVPRYYVFYNGTRKMDDEVLLRLTDSMEGNDAKEKSCVQFIAHMININAGHNVGIMNRCPLLYQYAVFIAEIRNNLAEGLALKDAINAATTTCIRRDILSDILRANRAEVTNMLLSEYDEDFHISCEKDISFKEGQESERKNTEKERQRADIAEKRADAAQEQARLLQLQSTILAYKLQGKDDETIASLTGQSLSEIQALLASVLKG